MNAADVKLTLLRYGDSVCSTFGTALTNASLTSSTEQWRRYSKHACVLMTDILNARCKLICIDIMNDNLTSLVDIYCS